MSSVQKIQPSSVPAVRPWWKEPDVWMVIAGPASAVLACAVTAVYILQGPDAVVSENAYKEGRAMGREVQAAKPPMQPANIGRNHSATGGKGALDAKP